MLEWAVTHVPFGMLLKTDDDSVVHINRLWQTLFRIGHASWPHLYAGHVVINGTVIRPYPTRRVIDGHVFHEVERKKWGVPVSLYAPDKYPPYASGGGYLLGHSAVSKLLRQAQRWQEMAGPPFPIEDAFVGVLASRAGLDAHHVPGFVDMKTSYYHEPLSTATIIHGTRRWRSADEWTRAKPLCRRATAHARRRL